jgi:hypothetical protein
MTAFETAESLSSSRKPAPGDTVLSIEGGAVRLDRCEFLSDGCAVDAFAGASLLARDCFFNANPPKPLGRQPAAATCESSRYDSAAAAFFAPNRGRLEPPHLNPGG